MGASDAELEERIIQHLAAAAAMGRARHIARREGQRHRASAQGRPQFLVFSTNPNASSASPASSSPDQRAEAEPVPAITVAFPSPSNASEESSQLAASSSVPSTQAEPVSASASGSSAVANQQGSSSNNRYILQVDFRAICFSLYVHKALHFRPSIKLYLYLFMHTNFYQFIKGGCLVSHLQVVRIDLDHRISNHFQNL